MHLPKVGAADVMFLSEMVVFWIWGILQVHLPAKQLQWRSTICTYMIHTSTCVFCIQYTGWIHQHVDRSEMTNLVVVVGVVASFVHVMDGSHSKG